MIAAGRLSTLLLIIVMPVLASSVASGQLRVENGGAIVAIANAFDRAQLTQDAATFNRMVGDDLVFIDGSGVRRNKDAFIAGWTAEGDRYEPIALLDRSFTRLGRDSTFL